MTYPLPVEAGDPIKAIEYNKLVDAVKEFSIDGAGLPRTGNQVLIEIQNTTGRNAGLGEILKCTSSSGTDATDVFSAFGEAVYNVIDPTWHTSIDKYVVTTEPIPDTERGVGCVWGHCLIRTNAANDNYPYVMIDSTQTFRAKPATSGIAKALFRVGTDYTLGILGSEQQLWRYELTANSAAPGDTPAKLIDLDGSEYAQSVQLSDPTSLMDDQTTGDVGWCIHVANKFYAIQAPCPPSP